MSDGTGIIRDLPDSEIESQIDKILEQRAQTKTLTQEQQKNLKRLKRVQSSRAFRAKEKQNKLIIKQKEGKATNQKQQIVLMSIVLDNLNSQLASIKEREQLHLTREAEQKARIEDQDYRIKQNSLEILKLRRSLKAKR